MLKLFHWGKCLKDNLHKTRNQCGKMGRRQEDHQTKIESFLDPTNGSRMIDDRWSRDERSLRPSESHGTPKWRKKDYKRLPPPGFVQTEANFFPQGGIGVWR